MEHVTIAQARDAITAVYPQHRLLKASRAKGAPAHIVTGALSGLCGRPIPEESGGMPPALPSDNDKVCSHCLSILQRKGTNSGSGFKL